MGEFFEALKLEGIYGFYAEMADFAYPDDTELPVSRKDWLEDPEVRSLIPCLR